jgi:hypothetical protein
MRLRRFLNRLPLFAIAALAAFIGCADHEHGAAGHRHESAHGGVAVELGEHQFYLDFLHDPVTGTLKAWVMDAHLENFVRIPAHALDLAISSGGMTNELTLVPVANPATGEVVGDTSQFEGQAEWLKHITNFSARVEEIEVRNARFHNVTFDYPGSR